MAHPIKLILAQINPIVGDITGNTAMIIEAYQQAIKQHQADLVLFPELAICGYPPEDLLLRSGFHQQIKTAMVEIAKQSTDTLLVIGCPTQIKDQRYNSALVFQNSQQIACYNKQQLPNYGVFDEKRYFTPGTTQTIIECKGIKCAITICEDIWDQPTATLIKQTDADLILNLSASPFEADKINQRQQLLTQRSQQTGLPIAYCNLVGGQDQLVFDGGSMLINNDTIKAHALQFESQLLAVNIDATSKPFQMTADSQPLLNQTAQIYQALVLGIRDYYQKNTFNGILVGSSGGIDSALTLAICVDAIGADHVTAILLPSKYTSDLSNQAAIEQAELLGIKHQSLPINSSVVAIEHSLHQISTDLNDITQQNIQARVRGLLLMALSNNTGSLLVSTGNKTEMAVGYSTLYGDMAGGFCALKDVPKMLVYQLAEYRNQQQLVIPQSIIDRPPSAELVPGQMDQDSLPPYPTLDAILYAYIDQQQTLSDIVKQGFDKAIVKKVIAMVNRSEYKRQQSAPGIKITTQAFGRERRYPITNKYKSS